MELFITQQNYIIKDGDTSLWCCRQTGDLEVRPAAWIDGSSNPLCLGTIHGVVGKVQYLADAEWRLILITQTEYKGDLPGNHRVFQISKIAVLPLNQAPPPADLHLNKCRKHSEENVLDHGRSVPGLSSGSSGAAMFSAFTSSSAKGIQAFKTFGDSIKTAAGNVKTVTGISGFGLGGRREIPREKFEKKMTEEIQKMFSSDGPGGCYFSPTGDLTNSIQHQNKAGYNLGAPLLHRIDEQFMWNRSMLENMTKKNQPPDSTASFSPFFVPVICGFVQIDVCHLKFQQDFYSSYGSTCDEYKIALISRRSRYRAGTRYKRRGIDQLGFVANHVETEQIIEVAGDHVVSFVQVRGSIPIFWDQPGLRYRPPPRIYKDFDSCQEAFRFHFDHETQKHKHLNVISLVDESGKEKILGDAYMDHVLALDSNLVTYVTFDFHEYCRGLKFENVTILLESLQDILKSMRYCWVDHKGLICEQTSVFRINCVDCLDRTNVVQTAIARNILEIQFRKVGLLPPEINLPPACRTKYQEIWANNGDALSRQYAGTAALKGDFTRTGERRFAGLMKDGYNSASRYYLNRFKDAYRQLAIDIVTGQPISDDFNALTAMIAGNEQDAVDGCKDEGDDEMTQECVKLLIDSCRKELLAPEEYSLGGWALIDGGAEDADDSQTDMDIVLLLSQKAFYVASYDDEDDKITHFQRIPLENLERIEVGLLPEKSSLMMIGGNRSSTNSERKSPPLPCIRLHFTNMNGKSGFSHMFRAAGLRFFNNMAVPIHTAEESTEALKAVYESFAAASQLHGIDLPLTERNTRLSRHKSLAQPHVRELTTELCLTAAEASGATLPRNFAMSPSPSAAFQPVKEETNGRYIEKNLKFLSASNVGNKISKLSPSNTLEFGNKIAGVGRGMNKLVSTLNPLKLSPNSIRRHQQQQQESSCHPSSESPSHLVQEGIDNLCIEPETNNCPTNQPMQYSYPEFLIDDQTLVNDVPFCYNSTDYSETTVNDDLYNSPNAYMDFNASRENESAAGFAEDVASATEAVETMEESTTFSKMKQSFSETSLGGIASAALGNFLDASNNAVSFHASTEGIAVGGMKSETQSTESLDVNQVGGARGTFLRHLPIPKLPASSAIKLTLSPSTPQKSLQNERELEIINKIQQSQTRVLRL